MAIIVPIVYNTMLNMIPARGPQTLKCKAVHGHESNITWSPRARQEDRGTGAHNMGTCPLTRLSPRG